MKNIDYGLVAFTIIVMIFLYGAYVVFQYANTVTPKNYNPANPLGLEIKNFVITKEGVEFSIYNPNEFDVQFYIPYAILVTSMQQRCSISGADFTGRMILIPKKNSYHISVDFVDVGCPKFRSYTRIPNIIFTLIVYYSYQDIEEKIEKSGVIKASASPTS